jgi:DNA ligase (NAD+)
MGITYDFTNWDGFGPNMNDSLHSFNYNEADELAMNILHIKNSLWVNPDEKEKKNNAGLNGQVFCVTGKLNQFKNRDELIAAVEAAGGKVVNSVSSKTNYLVTNDITSGSAKNKKAQELNIPIISETQLLELL